MTKILTFMRPPKCTASPACERPVTIRTTNLDPGVPESERTMELCYYHFWNWNSQSLRRRHHFYAANAIEELLKGGNLDRAPPKVQEPIDRRMFD